MQIILKSHGVHIALDASSATDLIKIKALAEMLGKVRISRSFLPKLTR